MRQRPLNQWDYSPDIDNQFRYLVTSWLCSLIPLTIIVLLPDPLHTSLLPFGALFGAQAFLYTLGLSLYGLEWLWRLIRPVRPQRVRCPVCHAVEHAYRPFYAMRISPELLRMYCPECHERWTERG